MRSKFNKNVHFQDIIIKNNTTVANHDGKLFNQMLITIIEPIITYTPSLFPSQVYRFLSFRVEVFAIFDILLRLNGFSEAYRKGRS